MSGVRYHPGQVVERLRLISRAHRDGVAGWICHCSCGQEKFVSSKRLCQVKSCGCLARETRQATGRANRTHGMRQTRLYGIWGGMIKRCSYQKNNNYERYGGRGITVCDEWKNSFEAFRDWALSNGYRDDLSIDRIDNDGNYEPGNCQWESTARQNQNTRANHRITHNGETRCLAEWAKIVGLNPATIRSRIEILGWPVERALGERVSGSVRDRNTADGDGITAEEYDAN